MAHPMQHPLASGRNVNIFQPPTSPASVNTSPIFSAATTTSNDYFSPRSRKRQRPDSSHGVEEVQTPWNTGTPSWTQCPTPSDAMYGSACAAQNSALINERYTLKDGYDTPGLLATDHDHSLGGGASEYESRIRMRDRAYSYGQAQGGGRTMSGPLARERNGAARMPSSANGSPAQTAGWTSFAFGLVGRAFSFGSNVIRGFYAGGGEGYALHDDSTRSTQWLDSTRPRYERGSTPVPGQWRDDDEFLGDFEQDNPNPPSMAAARPPNKRRQTDRDSWVMVGTPDVNDIQLSPKRKPSSNNTPRPSLGARSSASRANIRRTLVPTRRSSSYVTHTGSPATLTPVQVLNPDAESGSRRASFAPTRSPAGQTNGRSSNSRPSSSHAAAYVSPDVEKHAKRQAKQDRAADKAISGMSKQLQDLIRQGQEALGTKFSVQGDVDMDEGFVDEETETWS